MKRTTGASDFGTPNVDLDKLRKWKDHVVAKLTGGLGQLSLQRRIRFHQARAVFQDSHTLLLKKPDGTESTLAFDYALIATGSQPATLPHLNIQSPRVMDSTDALKLADVPKSLLVVGGLEAAGAGDRGDQRRILDDFPDGIAVQNPAPGRNRLIDNQGPGTGLDAQFPLPGQGQCILFVNKLLPRLEKFPGRFRPDGGKIS